MAGHSKWHNIQKKKGVTDAKRGKAFSQLSKNIRIAVKEGGSGDPQFNPSLRLALDKAKAANMPADNIKRAIDRGLGVGKGGQMEEVLYEGYGPHGIGFLVTVITDNKMRTASEIRAIFNKAGGALGGPGSAMYLFERMDGEYRVKIPLELSEEAQKQAVLSLEEILQDHDDVEEVVHNLGQS